MRSTKSVLVILILMMATMACSSLNQVTPAGMDDAAIEAELRSRLLDDVETKALELSIQVDDGVVTVSGNVDTMAQKNRITETARGIDGVRSVINNVVVR